MLPKALQTVGWKTPAAVRLIAVSPKVNAGTLLGLPGGIGSVTASRLLTAPSESPAFRVTWSPQHGNELAERQTLGVNPVTDGLDALTSHRLSPRIGLPPPLAKSYVTRRSPGWRFRVIGP